MENYPNYTPVGFTQYSPVLGYSTPNSGGNGRSAEVAQSQYQNLSPQLPIERSLEQQGQALNQFQYSQSTAWRNGYGLSHSTAQPQIFPTNDFSIRDLQSYSRPANEDPWTANSTRGAYFQAELQSFAPNSHVSKAHTVAGDAITPSIPRQSLTTSPDSGFESAHPAHLNEPKHPGQSYLHPTVDHSVYGSDLSPPQPKSPRSESRLQVTDESGKRRRSKAPVSPCSICHKDLKNPSDAYKHELQHTKPFRCEMQACARSREGFATSNDLQRHRKAVHGLRPEVGKETGYICRACPPASMGAEPKWWPRLDNFKAHIDRKHAGQDRAQLIKSSETPRPDNAVSESGYASHAPHSLISDEQVYQYGLASPMAIPMSRHASQVGDMALFGIGEPHLDALAGVGEGPLADSFSANGDAHPHLHGSDCGSVGNGLSMLRDAALHISSPVDSILTSPAARGRAASDVHISHFPYDEGTPIFNQIQWNPPSTNKWPEANEWASKKRGSTDAQDDLSIYRMDNGEFRCPDCPKTKKRSCDLRKHIKRHTRPYGCTFPNCYKRFGSRNDWKRHENSQHSLNEMWRCEIPSRDGIKCGKLFSQEGRFLAHLQRAHEMNARSVEMNRYRRDMHLGREGHHHFWCGFCNALVKQEDSTQSDSVPRSAWIMRFRHIGDHFDKHNLHIDKWVCIEHNKPKGLMVREEKRKAARHRARQDRNNDGSDLGDDGIPSPFDFSHAAPVSLDYQQGSSTKTSLKRTREQAEIDADAVSDSGC